jgi:hypothetical protein
VSEIGAEHDARPVPTGRIVPWSEGDLPHGENIDLNEYPVELLKFKKCRSFRADLRHKLEIIIRAYGGYGHRGVHRAARRLQCTRQSVMNWLRWDTSPRTRFLLERIDNAYAEAIEELVKTRLKKKRVRKKKLGENRVFFPQELVRKRPPFF